MHKDEGASQPGEWVHDVHRVGTLWKRHEIFSPQDSPPVPLLLLFTNQGFWGHVTDLCCLCHSLFESPLTVMGSDGHTLSLSFICLSLYEYPISLPSLDLCVLTSSAPSSSRFPPLSSPIFSPFLSFCLLFSSPRLPFSFSPSYLLSFALSTLLFFPPSDLFSFFF